MGYSNKQVDWISTVTTSWLLWRALRGSRYRFGMAIRPLVSRFIALAPENTLLSSLLFYKLPTNIHISPQQLSLGIERKGCQGKALI